ncbi:hypothetical protein TNCT_18891 [Trichonephila clavata]|uniref:Uncharacterized protein n=1 Tax=Trichonephila clavata TaxID=2740835 RepID=A0A8X6L0U2_TRICU|nr:hypothetical protein TNCT_18891 [Trichonephila clavata]
MAASDFNGAERTRTADTSLKCMRREVYDKEKTILRPNVYRFTRNSGWSLLTVDVFSKFKDGKEDNEDKQRPTETTFPDLISPYFLVPSDEKMGSFLERLENAV